ncbi:MAG: hypothetical protein IPN17_00135 [Deltaproteobacteria bacterium]|nr:hypothetical protein [Deltaproteobacteria bacterium]
MSPPSVSSAQRLRVAVHVDGFVQPRWIHRIVEDVAASPACTVTVISTAGAAPPHPPPSLARRLVADPGHAVLTAFTALDDRTYGRPNDALQPIDLRTLFGGNAPTEAADGPLDVVLSFGRAAVPGALASRARHGVWTLHFGPVPAHDAELVGLEEVLRGHGVIVTELRVDHARVLARSVSRTDVRSVRRGRNVPLLKCAALVSRALRELQHESAERADAGAPRFEFRPHVAEGPSRPTNANMASLLVDHGLRYAREVFQRRGFLQQWVLAYQISPIFPSTAPFRYLVPPADRFWADPFAAQRGDRRFILFEEAPFATGRGHIAAMELRLDVLPRRGRALGAPTTSRIRSCSGTAVRSS